MLLRRLTMMLLAALGAAVMVLPGAASAALSPLPVQELFRSDRIEDVTLFPEPTGNVVLAWTGQNNGPTVLATQRPPGGAFGPVQTVSTTVNAGDPRLARAPDGRLILVYSTATNAAPDEFAVRPAAGDFGPVQQLPLGERFSDVATDGAGNATVVWKGWRAAPVTPGVDDFVAVSTAPIGAPFPAPEALSPDADDNFIVPRIAMNPSGEAVVAWVRRVSPTEDAIEARIRTGGVFGPLRELARVPANTTGRVEVAIHDDGEAAIVWSRDVGPSSVVEGAFRAPGVAFPGGVQTLAASGSGPRVAIAPGGSAVIAWSRALDDDRSVVQAAIRPPGGSLGPPVDLSQPSEAGGFVSVRAVGFDASGAAVVGWLRTTGESVLAEAARRPVVGPFEPAVQVADMGATTGSLAFGVEPSGDVVAAWRERIDTSDPANQVLKVGGLRLLPDAATASADRCASAPPAPARPRSRPARFTLTVRQLQINQRIGQAAIRRLAAIDAWLDAGIHTRDLCGGSIGPADLAPGIASEPRGASLAALTTADPRPLRVAGATRRRADFTLSPRQLLINQRIYQAAVRRANAIQRRLAEGLTGGDLVDGAITQGKLHDRLRIVGVTPGPAVPPSVTRLASPSGRGGDVELSVRQLAINQRVAQAGVRRANDLARKLQRGLTGADFRDGTIGAADLAPDALP